MLLSVNAEASLTARVTARAETKVGVSDPAVCEWKCRRSTDKSYPGDNRLISPKSPHRRGGLAPVSYTHLDVYKRQDTNSDCELVFERAKVLEMISSFPRGNDLIQLF